ncbi:hypothetical protein [Streptomyces sp. RK75]|uniref:hypothetical protein n=1 Tax=Streptomyces sp. RK75 TaxID=2824895 RepID=UPI001FFCF5C5|nr:hypothetical protein [Streptomyces sp. RK75]
MDLMDPTELEELLHAEGTQAEAEFADHDTSDLTRRLALRIAQAEKDNHRARIRPSTGSLRGPSPERPLARGRRRRPTPIISTDPAAYPEAVVAHVRSLCDRVLRSHDLETLNAFAADYDRTGARTFACLLYTLDRREGALYWWRFAAGAGDPLAAHLLATHHAAVGWFIDARVWRRFARMLGFNPSRHLPYPVSDPDYPETVSHPHFESSVLGPFLHSPSLPQELPVG